MVTLNRKGTQARHCANHKQHCCTIAMTDAIVFAVLAGETSIDKNRDNELFLSLSYGTSKCKNQVVRSSAMDNYEKASSAESHYEYSTIL